MNNHNLTKQLPDDKLDRLIILVEGISAQQNSMKQKVDSIDRLSVVVESISARLEGISAQQNSMEQKVDSVDGRLSSLETTVDIRLKETRPIWEAIEARLEEVEINLDKVQAIAHDLRSDFRDWRRSINERVENLESKAS